MKYSKQIKPISYLKAHASEMAADAFENGNTYIITQNGKAKMALMDIKEYQKLQDKLALHKIIAISEKEISSGKTTPLNETFEELEVKISRLKSECNTK
ncbi:MAG: type II toxin-antitoxin system Phd/YefM family antitoxin [Ignavibacteria bacterium]|nr:type II toxin-antitoxin system Phd/YefM family antitoxin [Ignavibacteria bacterium]MCC7159319.1 type II toxin-antitoxin system Phd/YefM family antitoxin [Ignavibacteria bacterium]